MMSVSIHRAVVRNGRLVLDEPTNLPEGEVVELHDADPYAGTDDLSGLTAEERARMEAAIDRGLADARAGRTVSAEELFREIDSL
jgi:hypothetical protein